MMDGAVFFDRDGVLNEAILRDGKPYAPLTLDEFKLVDGAETDVRRLRDAGFPCFVITNQPELADGSLDKAVLERMHQQLRTALFVDDIFVCPHHKSEGCACHKPKPGLLHAAAKKHGIDLARSFVVGDRWRDIDAGRAVGAFTILVERPYSDCPAAHARVPTLRAAVDLILKRGLA